MVLGALSPAPTGCQTSWHPQLSNSQSTALFLVQVPGTRDTAEHGAPLLAACAGFFVYRHDMCSSTHGPWWWCTCSSADSPAAVTTAMQVFKPVLGTQFEDPRRCARRCNAPCGGWFDGGRSCCLAQHGGRGLRQGPEAMPLVPAQHSTTVAARTRLHTLPFRSQHPLASVRQSAEALHGAAKEFRRTTGKGGRKFRFDWISRLACNRCVMAASQEAGQRARHSST